MFAFLLEFGLMNNIRILICQSIVLDDGQDEVLHSWINVCVCWLHGCLLLGLRQKEQCLFVLFSHPHLYCYHKGSMREF